MKKSQLRKLIRESIKELVNEQQAAGCPNPNARAITFRICGPSSVLTQSGPITGTRPCQTVNGQVPQVGQKFDTQGVGMMHQQGSFYAEILSVDPAGPQIPGSNITVDLQGVSGCEGDTGSTGSKGCSLQDFQQAASGITLPAPFLGNIYNKFANHPDGCRFLNKRMQIQMQGSSNPTAAAQKANKVQAFQAIIAQCCN